jgi:hypothetical protein
MIQPAQWDAMGMECDKMNADAVTFHVKHVLADIQKHLGDLAGTTLTTLYFDSYEAGDPNWTPKMLEEFRNRRGYDILPWLPVFAGRTLGSKRVTDQFHADFQRTVKDLFRDCYWATPRALCHEAGLQFVAEPYTGPWEIDEVVKFLDHASMEFWTGKDTWSPVAADPIVPCAHELDQRIIAAESFTTGPELAQWNEHPAWLKPIGDAAFCAGVNRMSTHHFVQQPWAEAYRPGNAMGQWGTHFGRYQTWWEPGKEWFRYLWRCQTLLQAGVIVPASPETGASFQVSKGKLDLGSIHRRHKDSEIYFIANLGKSAGTAQCNFPIEGKQPELWDPVWGTMRDLPAFEQGHGSSRLELHFEPAQSFFVVFRKPAGTVPSVRVNFPELRTFAEVAGSWQVQFDPAWGGPPSIEFAALDDWTARPEHGIRYYSGTAVYRKSIHLDAVPKGSRVYLDLGAVNYLATVTVNGKRAGVVWTSPWRVEIGDAIKTGENKIEIAVTNVWANRLIGDEQEPPDLLWHEGDPRMKSGYFLKEFPDWFLKHEKRPSPGRYTFTTWNYFTKDSPLSPSGLVGPVRILIEA